MDDINKLIGISDELLKEKYMQKEVQIPDPPDELCIGSVGNAPPLCYNESYTFKKILKKYITLNNEMKYLDFGCCWGRIIRFFINDIKLSNIYGCDVSSSLLKYSFDSFKDLNINLFQNNPEPPLNIDNNSIDLITAYSIFSHLNEKYFYLWLDEFKRILKKGGYFIFTIRTIDFYFRNKFLPNGISTYIDTIKKSFNSLSEEEILNKYNNKEFIHFNNGGGPELPNSFYGDTIINPLMMEDLDGWDLIAKENMGQTVIILKKI